MRALVIHKKSMYQIYVQEKQNQHIKALLDSGDVTTKSMLLSHEQNQRTLEVVQKVLEKSGFKVVARSRQDRRLATDEDLVVSVGGDGTFLWAQGIVSGKMPIMGVNSDPGRSVGFLCAADMFTFEQRLEQYLTPEADKHIGWPMNRTVQRLQIKKNDVVVAKRVLNDVLFCHKHPASTSSYFLNEEPQKSSGIWICTPIGSTAAMKSAGGSVQMWHDNQLQYRVREPFMPNGKYKNLKGMIAPGNSLYLISKMRESILCWDGSTNVLNVEMGDKIEISHSPETLTWVK
jgi:NAD+ kinase